MKKKFIVSLMLTIVCLLIFGGALPILATVETDWPAGKANICKNPTDGFIDFEEGTDEAVIFSTIAGIKFTTTYGIDWRYGDIRTGKYNVYPYRQQGYETNGNFFAWLGVTGDTGRIDFTEGTATYLSVLTSTYSGLTLDAYDANGNFLATSGWATNNLHTRTFTRLTVEAPLGKTIAYVMVHDWGNYWLIDDLCTDAPGVPPAHYETAKLARDVVEADYTWGGKGWSIDNRTFLESSQIKNEKYKYWYWDEEEAKTKIGYGPGLDCSGVSFWSYNKTYGATNYLSKENPVRYENADGQYQYNFKEDIDEDDLLPGDLLFFDWDDDDYIDHVEMYVGDWQYEGGIIRGKEYPSGTYNVVRAYGDKTHNYGIVPDRLSNRIGLKGFVGFRRLTEPQVGIEFKGGSPIDLVITDPDGFTITKVIHEIPGVFYYSEWDIDWDGELNDMIIGPERKIGDYLIQVVPEPEALPIDTYSLEVTANGQTIILAENVPISDIPRTPFIIRTTETEIIPIIPAFVDFDPNTLNLKSKGQWVTSYIELPSGYDINTIDLESIRLNNQIESELKPIEIGDYDNNGAPDLMVKFNRSAVQAILEVGDKVKITISGKLINEKQFEGSDIIKVINKNKK